jgi:hypothetical protein
MLELTSKVFGDQIAERVAAKPLEERHRLQYLVGDVLDGRIDSYELKEVLWFGDAEYITEIIQERGHTLTGLRIGSLPVAI